MNFWIKHPRSQKPDAMLTVAIYSTAVVLLKFLLAGIAIDNIELGNIDAGTVTAILGSTLGAYAFRKMKDSPDKKDS